MPCDTIFRPRQTAAERAAEVTAALKRLEERLRARAIQIAVGPQGAIAFRGWTGDERGGLSDVCAYRLLKASGSYEMRVAIQRAEAAAGRRVNEQAIAAGVHSHDGGSSWNAGH